jgi:hypothetical protein
VKEARPVSKPIFAGLLSLLLAAVLSMSPRETRSAAPSAGAAQALPPAAAQAAPPAAVPAAPADAAAPAAVDTGCGERNLLAGYYYPGGRKTFDDERYSALALRLNTPVYQDSSGETRAAKVLQFSERVHIADPGEGTDRIRIKDNTSQAVGWVERSAVLCGLYPITDNGGTGLYKRVVVRTDTAVQGQVTAKKLYQTPEMLAQRCEGPCAEVSRFQWYFIYAEDNGHYLISSDANLGSSSGRLMGWLPKADGYVWNTALGLRPKEALAGPKGYADPPGAPEKYACAYSTMEQLNAAKPEDCNQILGGLRWFGLNVRMAVVQQTAKAYEVLFSNAGTAGRDNISEAAQGLNNLDVFFVLDGTKSMQPAITAIKALTAQINKKMQSKTNVVRYGFRIYRDSNPKTRLDGVSNSEALPLSKTVCDKTNITEFDAAFAPVKAYDPDEDDDFSENTFGGLVQAAEDVSGCPNNTKLIFVIGDAGYDGDKQRSRVFPVYSESQIALRFKNKARLATSKFETQPILVFIQPPRDKGPINNQAGYDKAYAAFKSQGQAILSELYGGTKITDAATNNFIELPQDAAGSGQQAAIDETLRRVDKSMNPDVIREVMQGVQAGQSLESIIERLRNNSQMNIPINYLQFVEESLCRRLGDQCRKAVLEAVNRAFVPVDDKVIPEVLLSRDQLDRWLKILNLFKSFGSNVAGAAGRAQLVNTMYSSIGSLVQIDMQNDGVSLANKLQFAAGLPNSGRSRLMQYSDSDLTNVNLVPACEIENLKQYSIKKYDLLNVVFSNEGKLRPVFTETTWPEGACPMSPKGKNVPFIDGDVRPQPINPPGQQTNYTMMHRRGNDLFFWLPVNYLP